MTKTNNMLQVFGKVSPPPGITKTVAQGGLVDLLSTILNFMVIIAGVYMLINILLAGYSFMNAGGDPKKVEEAWNKIWQSIVGLLIVAGSFTLAAILGQLIFSDATAILRPSLFTPKP